MINIFYDITMNCNLRCKHCYNAKHLKKGIPETIDIEKTFSNLLKLNPDIITIQGGEPLLVSNLENLILKLRNMGVQVYITTNATLLTPNRVVSLLKSKVNGIFFSIESADSLTNDLIRGNGIFEKVYENIKYFSLAYKNLYMKKLVQRTKLSLSVTLTSLNIKTSEDVEKIFKLAISLDIFNISFLFMVNGGNATQIEKNESSLDIFLAEKIAEISIKFPKIKVVLGCKKILFDYLKLKYGDNLNISGVKGKCPAGEKLGYVNEKLEFYPCGCINIFDEKHSFILSNKIQLERENGEIKMFFCKLDEFKKNMKKNQNKLCSSCQYKEECIPVCPFDNAILGKVFNPESCLELKRKISSLKKCNI